MEGISKKWMVSEAELDDEQYKIRQLKFDNYLIEGCAGSGKTVLALHKAKEIQDTKRGTYLVVIYTKALRSFIEDGVKSLGLDASKVCHYDDLSRSGISSADYIIVDEVQDFSREEISKLINMANENFIFFGDDAQQIYTSKTHNITLSDIESIAQIDSKNHKRLDKNYRLPRKVAKFAQSVTEKQNNILNRCTRMGKEIPMIIKCKGLYQELDYIINTIQNERWSDVGILLASNKEVISVKDYFESKGIDVEYKYDERRKTYNTLDFYSNKPKILTYHSSKGLQFENVFLPACEVRSDSINYSYKEALYVAVTRTCSNLFILYSNELSPFLKSIPREYYDFKEF
ncbi:3'-5' exonuclease [Clostridium cylindrosporum]|nr:3'-5' exonuclease [Clostridium cylindrosporum]